MKTTINVLREGEKITHPYSVQELEKLMGFTYQQTLCCESPHVYASVLKACQSKELENHLSPRQKWIGCYLAKEIISGAFFASLSLRFVNPIMGYGVFAEANIPKQHYIGSYTGEIKRRRFWSKRENDYSFEYSAGDFKTPFFIDAQKKGGVVRFINHSDKPNLETMAVVSGHMMHIILCTNQFIPQGVQLTYDYGEDYWKTRNDPM